MFAEGPVVDAGRLADRVAIVTGGASGIGAAVVEGFVREGARVCVFDRNPEIAIDLPRNYRDRLVSVVGDVRSESDNALSVERTLNAFGQIDVFVGNAGVFDFNRPVDKYPADRLSSACEEIFAINVSGYILGVAAALPALRKAKAPSIILTASNAGLYAGGGGVLYTASKHAVVGAVRQLAYELAPDIRVNAVAPGGTITSLGGLEAVNKADLHLNEIEGADRYISSGLPLRFTPDASDHVGAYILLASATESRATTGAVLPSDGGLEVR